MTVNLAARIIGSVGVAILCAACSEYPAETGKERTRGDDSPVVAAGHALVADQSTVDLGRIARGSKATADFVVRNTGSSAVSIDEIRQSCACTEVQVSDRRLAPGDAATIQVVIDTSDREGKLAASVELTFRTDGSARQAAQLLERLVAKGDVYRTDRLVVAPNRIGLSGYRPGARFDQSVIVLPWQNS
ncbi:MAG: DUF1573 domain-containing protein [Planctomyces sp.]|nr:DUF1573 domain-containing protein [Planctomyces sp.]